MSQDTYTFFISSYNNSAFPLAGKVVYEIVFSVLQKEGPLSLLWQEKFEKLFQFLHETGFVFDSSDAFYDMVAIIAMQIRKNPNIHWRALLN